MALHNYHTTSNTFPPFSVTLRDRAAPPWSALVRLLPYIEPSDLASGVDLDATSGAWSHATLAQTRVAAYLCPSEVYDRRRPTATMTSYPSNHAFNCGTWLVSDPAGGPVGDGAFVPDRAMRQGDFTDGLGQTMALAETKAYQPYFSRVTTSDPLKGPAPSVPSALKKHLPTRSFDSTGHTQWVVGDVAETGFTTTFAPNTYVALPHAGRTFDADFVSTRAGESPVRPIDAAVTARSYHPGGVNVLMMDGSGRFVRNDVGLAVWRALGTRAGGGDSD